MAPFSQWLSTEMRRRRIWSINRLARESGLDALTVGDWLLDRERPTATEAARLARYLGLPVDHLNQIASIGSAEGRGRRLV